MPPYTDAELRRALEHSFPFAYQRTEKTDLAPLTAFESGMVGFMVGVVAAALILFGFHYHVL